MQRSGRIYPMAMLNGMMIVTKVCECCWSRRAVGGARTEHSSSLRIVAGPMIEALRGAGEEWDGQVAPREEG